MYGFGRYNNGICHFGYDSSYYGLWHILILIAVVTIVLVLLLSLRKRKSTSIDVVESLKLLYVKGDISEEEYLKRKNVIERK